MAYQDFGKTPFGFVKIDTQAIVSLVSRHLPSGALCTAVRMRPHDRLCLVVISDRREFWSREDDLRRARAITDELRLAGMELPRLRWIRTGRSFDQPSLEERGLFAEPSFWGNAACALYACFALSWGKLIVYVFVALASWLTAFWLTSGGGWRRLRGFFRF